MQNIQNSSLNIMISQMQHNIKLELCITSCTTLILQVVGILITFSYESFFSNLYLLGHGLYTKWKEIEGKTCVHALERSHSYKWLIQLIIYHTNNLLTLFGGYLYLLFLTHIHTHSLILDR
jgi:hypothetical protein